MNLDKFKNPVFEATDIFELLYKGKADVLPFLIVKDSEEIKLLEQVSEITFQRDLTHTKNITVEQFDKELQQQWNMPKDYCPTLIEDLYALCSTQEERDRLTAELEAFINHGMMDLLFYLKYLVDTLRENNIVWGVGRGSSVSSFVLYLIGVHKINPLKYNLDWQEFLR